MTRFPARAASLLSRRFAAGAAVLTLSGAAAGGAAFAVINTPSPATDAQLLAATTSAGAAPVAGHAGHHHGLGLAAALIHATAKETGLAPRTVRQDLASGKTLDQIAGGKSGAVENDVLTALQHRLDAAVDKGTLTKDKEADLLGTAKTRIETLMSSSIHLHHNAQAPSS